MQYDGSEILGSGVPVSGAAASNNDPMDYQAWWNSLSDDQRMTYITSSDGSNRRAKAYQGYLDSFKFYNNGGQDYDGHSGSDITGKDSYSYGSTDYSGFDQASWTLEQQWKLDEAERQFNSAEAQKTRDWQQYMSDTAVSRAVADIKKAGLNPWLALNGGSLGSASTPSGATASSSSGSSKMPHNYLVQLITAVISSAAGVLKGIL